MSELYIVGWPKNISAVYVHGATLTYSHNKPVYYANEVLSPGQTICTWQSASDYLETGIAPSLPLLQAGEYYTLSLHFEADNDLPVQVQLNFFDIHGEKLHSYSSTDYSFRFQVPKGMVSYEIRLVNLRHHWIKFDYLALQKIEEDLVIERELGQHYSWAHAHLADEEVKDELRLTVNYGIKSILSVPVEKHTDYEQAVVCTDGQNIEELIEKLVAEFQVKRGYQLVFEAGLGFYTLPDEIINKMSDRFDIKD